MPTTQQLKTKITELTTKVEQLKQQSDINLLTASPEQIIKNAAEEQQARESTARLEEVIAQLRSQLEVEGRSLEAEGRRVEAEKGFTALIEQGDRVQKAAELFEKELAKLREMGKTVSYKHKQVTGRIALDDRLSRDFRMPIIEQLGNSIIMHNETRNYAK